MRLFRLPRLAPFAFCLAAIVVLGSVPLAATGTAGAAGVAEVAGVAGAAPRAGAVQPSDAAQPRWRWPVDPPHATVRPFQAPATPYSAGHRGIDLAAEDGAPVYAPADGTVYFAGTVVDRGVLSIAHDGGYLSSFEPVSTNLTAGQQVTAGQQIGVVSGPAHCAAACLHFGLRKEGLYVSPLLSFSRIPPAILLPLDG
jgi:murein DD-endopeptidase MepM/ murein hydrolase activator NlpD